MGTVVHRDAKGRVVRVEGSEVVTDPDERRGDRGKVTSDRPDEARYPAEKPKSASKSDAKSDSKKSD